MLEKEKSEIEIKLDLAKSNQNQMMDRQNTLTLIELVRTRDEYEAQIKEERKRIQELDVQTQVRPNLGRFPRRQRVVLIARYREGDSAKPDRLESGRE